MFDSITNPAQRAFLTAFAECGDVREAAVLADISRDTHYNWKTRSEDYAAAFTQAEQMAADALEGEMHKEARLTGSFKARAFLLRGLKPERYSTKRIEKNETKTHNHNVRVDLSVLTDAELQQLIDLTRKCAPHRLVVGGTGPAIADQAPEPAE